MNRRGPMGAALRKIATPAWDALARCGGQRRSCSGSAITAGGGAAEMPRPGVALLQRTRSDDFTHRSGPPPCSHCVATTARSGKPKAK
jgi:hypothetical protein